MHYNFNRLSLYTTQTWAEVSQVETKFTTQDVIMQQNDRECVYKVITIL